MTDSTTDHDGTTAQENGTTSDATTEPTAATRDDVGDALLEVSSVRRSFGDVSVLEDVSFSLSPGTVTCVVGANGSGKTTLLRIVAGLLAPSGGSVSIASSSAHPVGYLPQSPSFRSQFTLTETLAFYGALAGVELDADATLARVGLGAVADRRVEALSGGMTRLFGIAQATIGNPPLLVLDEPASGLDPTMTEHIGDVITDLAAGMGTVLLATHDLTTVDRVADTVLVLDGGEISGAGSPGELRAETGVETLAEAVSAHMAGGPGELTVRSGHGGEQE